MIKCKIIRQKSLKDLENTINTWLDVNSFKILNQSVGFDPVSPTKEYYFVSIFYDDGKYENSNRNPVPQPIRDSQT